MRIGASVDQTGVVTQYIYGTKPNIPDLAVRNGVTYRVISDHLGSPRMLVNTANPADIPFRVDYDAWGKMDVITAATWFPFGFAGGLYDADTKLTRFGARDYDAEIGRWVSKDPIGFDAAGTDLFAYANGDPVNRIDPTGMDPMMGCTPPKPVCPFGPDECNDQGNSCSGGCINSKCRQCCDQEQDKCSKCDPDNPASKPFNFGKCKYLNAH